MNSRNYRSPRRADAAASTRRAILEAAEAAFQRNGYQATSVSEIAEAAQVSVNTIYVSVGNKPQLFVALIGDAMDDSAVGQTLDAVAVETAADRIIQVTARGTRKVFETHAWVLGALYDNAAADPQFAAVIRRSEAEYKRRLSQVAERLDNLGLLRAGGTKAEAAAVLWFFFGFRPWRDLLELGWTWDQAEGWLIRQAALAIF